MARPDKNDKKYGLRTMRLGDEGYDVWELQLRLLGWGSGTDNDGIGSTNDPVAVTGKFDTTTRDAVRRFQKGHALDITGVADGRLLKTIDREPADHVVFMHLLKCPCTRGKNDGPILCRCNAHTDATQKCTTGFGRGVFAGGAFSHADNLDLYDKREYDGMDKAVIWAVRGLMHRANVADIEVIAGYQCWWDNYHATDDSRWIHRTSTFHLGKTIEIRHRGVCTTPNNAVCPTCTTIQGIARTKCGFQLRWHEPNRVSVAEVELDCRPPATPHMVHVDTVRRVDRELDEFVKTDEDARKPIYEGKVGFCFPVRFEDAMVGTRALDPLRAPTAVFFDNTEDFQKSLAGNFPVGNNRVWHSGVHIYVPQNKEIHAIADGEIVGCRVGEGEQVKEYGSRNFVLLRHKRKDKFYYSLYMHLDDEAAKADATVAWRKQLFLLTKEHARALAPSGIFKHDPEVLAPLLNPHPTRLVAQGHKKGLAVGEIVEVTGGNVDAKTLEPTLPDNSVVRKVVDASLGVGDFYIFTKIDNVDVAEIIAADNGLAAKFDGSAPIALAKPIPVAGGDVIGKAPNTAKDGTISATGNFFHLEVFSKENLLPNEYKVITVAEAKDAVSRDKVRKALVDEGLIDDFKASVFAKDDVDTLSHDPGVDRFRNLILKMPSPWALDWKAALTDAETVAAAKAYGFMKDDARNALGDAFNEYRFWNEVKTGDGNAALPDTETVHHYNPISLLLHFAHTPEK